MNLSRIRLLFTLCFTGIFAVAQAQLPLRGTRWKGVIFAPTEVKMLVTFRADTLIITTEADNMPVETMRYQQMGDTLQLQEIAGKSPCNINITGLYRLNYVNNGEGFGLQPIRDECLERQNTFKSKTLFVRLRPNPSQPPRNWPYLDPTADSVAGISLYRAYDLLKNKQSVPVIVGVLDSGVDLTHEDLRDVIWLNPKEIPNNKVDDDKNGYADDVNGWNFMGAKDGTTYEYDQPEITQTYLVLKSKYDNMDPAKLRPTEKRQYNTYQTAKKQYLLRFQQDQRKRLAFADTVKFWQIADQIQAKLADSATSQSAIRQVDLGVDSVAMMVRTLLADTYLPQYGAFRNYLLLVRRNWTLFRQMTGSDTNIAYNPDYNARKAVGDDPADPTERYYGSPQLLIGQSQQLAMHGSHVAGIIAAKRGNGRGIDGVADNVRIMPVSVVPSNGDERDKDVANGIRYAVENGAKVINMSFGKRLSPFKEQIDSAIRFAEDRDVLIVHAAGNNGENYDSLPAYPSARYENGQTAQNVLVVGNSAWRVGEGLPSLSSNYGVQTVDLFAPGTDILSTLPNNRYASFSGTSMASPMTAGVAALLLSYFPKLTAVQVKDILLKSSYKPDVQVRKPGRSEQKIAFKNLSRSGGLLNAYEAVKLAMELTGKK
ncbi:S8 family peptidase [Spirosoma flavum]|uniref:S8 family peptidase n=1 Tax=Spirosoma flavum TaxID=2048557 RepID=A0ABW6AJ82_9BACT